MTQKHTVPKEMVYFLNSKYGHCEQKYNFAVLCTLVSEFINIILYVVKRKKYNHEWTFQLKLSPN